MSGFGRCTSSCGTGTGTTTYVANLRASVTMPFSEWVVTNKGVFTSPYDSTPAGRFWPEYAIRHSVPENRKSQFVYLRPDLGTVIYWHRSLQRLATELDMD